MVDVSEDGLFANQDKRGCLPSINKTSNENINAIKLHIESFPKIESHYTRKSTKRLYLDEKLSISKMYELFVEKFILEYPGNMVPSLSVYRNIFCTSYNLSFFKPKKDQCASCNKFKSATLEKKSFLEEDYNKHIERMHQSFIAKDIDNTLGQISPNYVVASFDLQSTLQIPSSDVSLMYYSRKLNMYNLTVYESSPPHNAHCFTWAEINGKRGRNEIGSCLLRWFLSLPEDASEVTLYSDTCGGQNQNYNIMALMIYIVQKTNIHKIEHKFLESGHTMIEVDSMHSAIENAKRNVPVFSVHDWITLFKTARSNRNRNKNKKPYIVEELSYKDFVDLQKLSALLIKNKTLDTDDKKINWLKVKGFEYTKSNPYLVGYKYDYFGEYKQIDVRSKKKKSNKK